MLLNMIVLSYRTGFNQPAYQKLELQNAKHRTLLPTLLSPQLCLQVIHNLVHELALFKPPDSDVIHYSSLYLVDSWVLVIFPVWGWWGGMMT